jgi:hypothetical protein
VTQLRESEIESLKMEISKEVGTTCSKDIMWRIFCDHSRAKSAAVDALGKLDTLSMECT